MLPIQEQHNMDIFRSTIGPNFKRLECVKKKTNTFSKQWSGHISTAARKKLRPETFTVESSVKKLGQNRSKKNTPTSRPKICGNITLPIPFSGCEIGIQMRWHPCRTFDLTLFMVVEICGLPVQHLPAASDSQGFFKQKKNCASRWNEWQKVPTP